MKFKCLTVCQPYAWGTIAGPKRIENRNWRMHHRGWLAIHAGLSRKWLDSCRECPDEFSKDKLLPPSLVLNDNTPVPEDELIYGAVLGLIKVVNCLAIDDPKLRGNPFAVGPWCIMLDQPRPLIKPFFVSGQQGLWDVDIPDEYIGAGHQLFSAISSKPDRRNA